MRESNKRNKRNENTENEEREVGREGLPAGRGALIEREGAVVLRENRARRKTSSSRRFAWAYACVALSLVLCFALILGALCVLPEPPLAGGDVEASADGGQEAADKRVVWVHEHGEAEGAMSVPELYDACIASVVSIRTEKESGMGIGSGVILREDGYVGTAAHVVEACARVEVILSDGRRFEAETVGCDTLTDLALLKIDAEDLTAATLGTSSALLAGERVVAIGTPASLDYAGSVCSGEISCALRTVKFYSEEGGTLEKRMKLIQMSAPVNPGNSGCPLFDAFGRVVGIVTMKLGQQFSGIGFAIPSDGASLIWEAMRTGEVLDDGVLSAVSLRAATLGIEGEAYEMGGAYGVRITGLVPPQGESPLRAGDMILRVGEVSVRSLGDVERVLRAFVPGDCVSVTVVRGGQELAFEVVLGALSQAKV